MASKQRFEEWVAKLNARRVAASDAEVDFWSAVLDFKRDERAWKEADGFGYFTFREALHVSGVGSPHEFDKFEACVAKLGNVDAVRTIGFGAAKELLDVPDDRPSIREPAKTAMRAAFDEMVDFRARNGKEPAVQSAANTVRKHYAPPLPDVKADAENAFDRLKRENAELRAENRRLTVENRRLASMLGERGSDRKTSGTARRGKKAASLGSEA